MKLSAVLCMTLAAMGASAQNQPGTAKPKTAAPAKTKATPAKPAPAKPASPVAAPAAAPAAGEDRVVLTVGSEKLTAREFDQLIEALPEQVRQQARGPMKRQMAEQIVRVKLLASEARKRGLDQEESVRSRLRFQTENLLAGAAFNKIQEEVKVTDDVLRKAYEQRKNEFESIQARHILIKFKGSPVPQREGKPELTEEEALAKAQAIRKRLAAGEDFAKLAKEESDDTGSGANGGDLGTFSRGQMVPEFEKAAFALPVNETSEPVRTQFGYHLIRADKHETKTFEDVKEQLESQARPEAARESIEELRRTATVEIDDAYFGPATPPAPAGPAAPAAPAGSAQ